MKETIEGAIVHKGHARAAVDAEAAEAADGAVPANNTGPAVARDREAQTASHAETAVKEEKNKDDDNDGVEKTAT